MRYTKQVELAAPPERVWSVLADVERWPSWTPTVTALDVLDAPDGSGPALREGAEVRITQPGMRPTRYTVTGVEDGRWFRWEARRPGLRQHADHAVEAAGDRCSRATLTFGIDGPVGWLVSPLARPTVRRMVDAEAEALRARVEEMPAQER